MPVNKAAMKGFTSTCITSTAMKPIGASSGGPRNVENRGMYLDMSEGYQTALCAGLGNVFLGDAKLYCRSEWLSLAPLDLATGVPYLGWQGTYCPSCKDKTL